MPATLTQVRNAIATRLLTVDGIKEASATVPGSISSTPAAEVQPAPGEVVQYMLIMDADDVNYLLLITVWVQIVQEGSAQDKMDAFLSSTGASSVRAAVNGTLGGIVRDCRVTMARNYRPVEVDTIRYLAVDFVVEVMA